MLNKIYRFVFGSIWLFFLPVSAAITMLADGYTAFTTSPTPLGYVATTLACAVILGIYAYQIAGIPALFLAMAAGVAAWALLLVAALWTHPLLSSAVFTAAIFTVGLSAFAIKFVRPSLGVDRTPSDEVQP